MDAFINTIKKQVDEAIEQVSWQAYFFNATLGFVIQHRSKETISSSFSGPNRASKEGTKPMYSVL